MCLLYMTLLWLLLPTLDCTTIGFDDDMGHSVGASEEKSGRRKTMAMMGMEF